MKTAFPYTRIPGRRRGVLFSSTLWMGEDHLLLVRNSRFSEAYKRFFYRDIEALLIRRSARFSVPPYWLLGFVLLLFALIPAVVARNPAGIWTLSAILVAMTAYLLVESLFLSCTTHIRTAVSSEELSALFRTRHALRAAELIAAKIEKVQGVAEPVEVQRHPQPEPIQPPLNSASAPDTPPSRTALTLVLASFLFLLVDAAFTYYSGGIAQLTPRLIAINSVLMLAEAALLLAALISFWPGNPARAIRNLIIAALVFSGLVYYAGYMISQIKTAVAQANVRASTPFFSNSRAAINRIDEIGNVVLGIAGLIAWTRYTKR